MSAITSLCNRINTHNMNTLSNEEAVSLADACKGVSIQGVEDYYKLIQFTALLHQRFLGKIEVSHDRGLVDILQTMKTHNYKLLNDYLEENIEIVMQIAFQVLQLDDSNQKRVLYNTFSALVESSKKFENTGTPQIPIFSVSRDGIASGSELYLVGSCHIGTSETKEILSSVEPLYNHCQTVVFEVYQDSDYSEILQQNPNLAERLVQSFRITEWFRHNSPLKEEWGVESLLVALENFGEKKIRSLETVLDQYNATAAATKNVVLKDAAFDREFIADAVRVLIDIDGLKRIYYPIGKKPLATLRTAIEAFDPTYYRKIYSEREEKWLPQIEEMLRNEGSHLVVVGAMHLVGNDGLVNILRSKGYDVRPITNSQDLFQRK